MQTLTLENLSPYLPYGLKMYNPKSGQIVNVIGISKKDNDLRIIIDLNNSGYLVSTFIPALRPVSDYKRIFDECLSDMWSNFEYFMECVENGDLPYHQMIDLIKEHFDVFNLIEQGLAIDINTL